MFFYCLAFDYQNVDEVNKRKKFFSLLSFIFVNNFKILLHV